MFKRITMRNPNQILGPAVGAISMALALAAGPVSAAEATNGINGALLYHNYCSVCHGDHGNGESRASRSLVPPPKDFTKGELPRDYMIAIVGEGKTGTAMVGWKTQLNAAEIAAVVDYVRSTFMQGAGSAGSGISGVSGTSAHGGRARDAGQGAGGSTQAPLAAADMSLPFPGNLKGNPVKGEKFYMDNCATCHGKSGDGNGPRAYFINPKPRDFLLAGSRAVYNRPALFAAVSMGSAGTEMPAWSKVLTEQEMADVAEFVFVRFIQPSQTSAASKTK